MRHITWVLFDLGGVVLRVDQTRIFEQLAGMTGLDADDIGRLLGATPNFWHDFMVREYTPSQVAQQVNILLRTQLGDHDIENAINAELGAPIEETCVLVPLLRTRVSVGCLSNTNSIHWDRMLNTYEVMGHFDRRFASQMLGHAKPSSEIYRTVSENLGVAPNQILFFDDRVENVRAAHNLGWNARVYRDHAGMLADLREWNLD